MRKLLLGETWQLPLAVACAVAAAVIAHLAGGPAALCAVLLIVGAALGLAASLRA